MESVQTHMQARLCCFIMAPRVVLAQCQLLRLFLRGWPAGINEASPFPAATAHAKLHVQQAHHRISGAVYCLSHVFRQPSWLPVSIMYRVSPHCHIV